jgi:hypothetical protein
VLLILVRAYAAKESSLEVSIHFGAICPLRRRAPPLIACCSSENLFTIIAVKVWV